jgi:hypothetical protein
MYGNIDVEAMASASCIVKIVPNWSFGSGVLGFKACALCAGTRGVVSLATIRGESEVCILEIQGSKSSESLVSPDADVGSKIKPP